MDDVVVAAKIKVDKMYMHNALFYRFFFSIFIISNKLLLFEYISLYDFVLGPIFVLCMHYRKYLYL